jgi:phosphomannomutase/phosphoglucomutase
LPKAPKTIVAGDKAGKIFSSFAICPLIKFMDKTIFREYDIRGVVGKDLTSEDAKIIAKAYAEYLQEFGVNEVIVGRDNRLSSLEFQKNVIEGLISYGCRVIDIGEVTSPIFYFARVFYKIDGGIMITASHNPKEYNGFKLAHGFGTIYGKEIQRIYGIAKAGNFRKKDGGKVEKRNIVPEYYKMLKEKIKLSRSLKAAVDCGNGVVSDFAPAVLKNWGCEIYELFCQSDGNFPNHQPDPVKTQNLQDLVKLVKEKSLDLGIGFDADGDRLGIVDEKGNIIWGDMYMVLFFREVLKKYPKMICLIEVKCSQALVEMVKKFNGRPLFYKTGHSLIKAKMQELKTKFTGEMSGHMFFADEYYGYDDAFYAAGRLLRILSQTKEPLSKLFSGVPKYYSTPEVRVSTSDKEKFNIVADCVKYFKEKYKIEDIDGVRIFFSDGWGLIRASNTQPVLVVRAEAKSEEKLEEYKKILEEKLLAFSSVKKVDWSGREG